MLERFSATLDPDLLKKLDGYLDRHGYQNRSEAVRDLTREARVKDEWNLGKEEVMGVISLVYDHHQPGLLARMTRIQHDSEALIITTSHIHMDHDNCPEIIIARGTPARVRALSDKLTTLRGVKSGSLSATTTGRRIK